MPTKTKAKPAKGATKKPAKKSGGKSAAKPLKKAVTAKPAAARTAAPKAAAAASTVPLQKAMEAAKAFFDRTISVLDESDSTFAPTPGVFTAAQQVAHVAQTFDWFLEGAFRPEGFNTDFEGLERTARACTSLAQAKAWLDQAYGRMLAALKERPAAEWQGTIAADTIMGGEPRTNIVNGLADHTAHHRGSLAVYARLRGKTPLMPYG